MTFPEGTWVTEYGIRNEDGQITWTTTSIAKAEYELRDDQRKGFRVHLVTREAFHTGWRPVEVKP